MSGEEPGIKPVVLYVNGEAVSTLNPLPATGGGVAGVDGTHQQRIGVPSLNSCYRRCDAGGAELLGA